MNPYQVLGRESVIFRGRQRLVKQLTEQITKPTPDHVQVVGSKFIGKTVLLRHFVKHFQSGKQSYTTSLYWDLGHQTPNSDANFLSCFAKEIRSALMPYRPDIANELDPIYGDISDILPTVIEMLEDDKQQLLVVLDGFDKVLGMTSITRNLWDYLRALAEKSSLTIVTGSRRPLRELCKTEGSQTSDFWNVFNPTPLKVGIFDDRDWSEMLAPFKDMGISFDGSGQKELINWSGGVPILAAAMCEQLLAQIDSGNKVFKEQVDSVAADVFEQYRTLLDELWDDCSMEVQSDLIDLTKIDIHLSRISDQRREFLEIRGYAKVSGSQLKANCRLLQKYVEKQGSQVTDLRRLFSEIHDYERNVRSLLELRLAQIPNGDRDLQRQIEYVIRELNTEPTDAVIWFRNITDKALDLIWNAELPTRKIPQDWIDQWHQDNEWTSTTNNLPNSRGIQCDILRVMTNTRKGKTRPVARFVSKSTVLLISHIQSFGDFGQHTEGQKVSLGTAVALCLSVIELYESLSRELAKDKNSA